MYDPSTYWNFVPCRPFGSDTFYKHPFGVQQFVVVIFERIVLVNGYVKLDNNVQMKH